MSVATSLTGIIKQERRIVQWVPFYTTAISLVGCYVAGIALLHYDGGWLTVALFAAMAVVTELLSAESFVRSRTYISIASVISIAALMSLGPWAGVITHLAGGAATLITALCKNEVQPTNQQRASLWQRSAFNMSMTVLSSAAAGQAFILTGGLPGYITEPFILLPLLAAVLAETVVNIGVLSVVIRLQTNRTFRRIWVDDFQWGAPIVIGSGFIGGGCLAFAYQTAAMIGLLVFFLPILATSYAFHLYINHTRSYVDQLEKANHQLDETNRQLLHTLGSVIDAYDIYTAGHSAQVARYAGAIAAAMGLSATEQDKIVRGALIHDVGKVGVADAIIEKPGRLTDEEFEMMKLHTVIGAAIVSNLPQLAELVPLVRNHHERWDGHGYPDQLKGEGIPLGARVLAVADTVEAMLSDRPYRATLSLGDVVAEVIRCSGKQFDPVVVTAFLAVVQSQGADFFVNSAAAIARNLEQTGGLKTLADRCYAKKSMLSLALKQQ